MNVSADLLALALFACDGRIDRLAARVGVSRVSIVNWIDSPAMVRAKHLDILAEIAGRRLVVASL